MVGVVKSWDGISGTSYKQLSMRPCTYEELGLDKEEEISETAKFYPAHKSSRAWLKFYWKKLMCYDEQVDVHGNFDSDSVTHLHFYFKRCNQAERSTC